MIIIIIIIIMIGVQHHMSSAALHVTRGVKAWPDGEVVVAAAGPRRGIRGQVLGNIGPVGPHILGDLAAGLILLLDVAEHVPAGSIILRFLFAVGRERERANLPRVTPP